MPASKPLDISELREGTITALRAQRNDSERISVFIDDEFAFGLSAEIVLREGLRKGLALSAAEQTRLLEQEQRSRAKRAALDFVAHRPRTETEVARRLEKRGFPDAITGETLEWLRGLGYVDDADYANRFVRERLGGKGHGPARVRSDLLRRGVDRALIEAVLTEAADPDAIREAALDQARARWERLVTEQDLRKRRKKVSDYLARRGYDFDMIREVVDSVGRNEDESGERVL